MSNVLGGSIQEAVAPTGWISWFVNHPLVNHPITKRIGGVIIPLIAGLATYAVIDAVSAPSEPSVESDKPSPRLEAKPSKTEKDLSELVKQISPRLEMRPKKDSPDHGDNYNHDDPFPGNPRGPRDERGRGREPERQVPDKEHRHRPEKDRGGKR